MEVCFSGKVCVSNLVRYSTVFEPQNALCGLQEGRIYVPSYRIDESMLMKGITPLLHQRYLEAATQTYASVLLVRTWSYDHAWL
jgi:hypothetical protein